MSERYDVTWYICRNGKPFGPFSEAEFAKIQAERQLQDTDYIWCTGLDRWLDYQCYRTSHASRVSRVASIPEKRKCAMCLLLRRILRTPRDTILSAFQLITKPGDFAHRRVDAGPRDLARACYFWLNLFTFAFLINTSLSFLDFFSGANQARHLVLIAVQIILAIPIIYLLNVLTRQPTSLSGITQAVLYIDAPYLVLQALLAGSLSYIAFRQAVDTNELDVISTEYQKCLSAHSYVHWAIRGEVQYFYHVPFETAALAFAETYYHYFLIAPFCFVFGRLMHGRYVLRFGSTRSLLLRPTSL